MLKVLYLRRDPSATLLRSLHDSPRLALSMLCWAICLMTVAAQVTTPRQDGHWHGLATVDGFPAYFPYANESDCVAFSQPGLVDCVAP